MTESNEFTVTEELGQWLSVRWAPLPENFVYSPASTGWDANPVLAFLVSGAASAQTFMWEYHQVVEFVGQSALALTESHSDPIGMSALLSAWKKDLRLYRPQSGPSSGWYNGVLSAIASELHGMSCPCPPSL